MAINIENIDIDVFDVERNGKISPLVQGTSVSLKLKVNENGSPLPFESYKVYVVSYSKLDGVSTKSEVETGDVSKNNNILTITSKLVTRDANRCSIIVRIGTDSNYVYTTPLYYYVTYNPAYELEDNTSTN